MFGRAATIGVFFALVVVDSFAAAEVIYVDESATGANTGSSWVDAYTNLQDGLAAAQSGDEVRIGQGTYKPTDTGDRELSFALPDGVIVLGGYAGAGAIDPDANDPDDFETILSGDLNGDDGKPGSWFNYGENSYNVVTSSATGRGTEMRGVTVRAGNANFPQSGPDPRSEGGGIRTEGTLTVVECVVEDNKALFAGGGIRAAVLLAHDTVIRRNQQVGYCCGFGGGAWVGSGSTFTDCRFEYNRGWGGGASAGAVDGGDLTVDSCIFIGNYCNEDGGAMSLFGDNTVTGCDFFFNGAGVYGGAIRINVGSLSVSDTLFQENHGHEGGAINASGRLIVRDSKFRSNIYAT
jgi:hypothetical protein